MLITRDTPKVRGNTTENERTIPKRKHGSVQRHFYS